MLAIYCFAWAGLIMSWQGGGWFRTGEWQPVPAYALFVNTDAQSNLQVFGDKKGQPLQLVPAWGGPDSSDAEAIAESLAGKMLGMRKILLWLIELSLVGWLVVVALLFWGGAGMAILALENNARLVSRKSGSDQH